MSLPHSPRGWRNVSPVARIDMAHTTEHHHRALSAALVGTLFVVVVGVWVWSRSLPAQSVSRHTVDLTGFRLEIADTDAARTQGLSGRDPLKSDEGMLFQFPQAGVYPFWMKEMKFALDIVWIRDGRVVDVATLPPPKPIDPVPPTHIPTQKADQVLEINAGFANKLGLEPGVYVILP